MLQAIIWLPLALAALSVVARVILWPVDSYRFQRLANLHSYPRPWLAWVPFFRTHIVATSAGDGWLSWLVSQVPIITVYVEWGWWEDIAYDLEFRHASLRALGIVDVPILRTILIGGIVDKAAARSEAAPELRVETSGREHGLAA